MGRSAKSRAIDGMVSKLRADHNMFELSVDTYNRALEIASNYLDAISSRSGTLTVLGKYMEAGEDYDRVMDLDHEDIFTDMYSNIARILVTKKKDAIFSGGWKHVKVSLERLIPKLEDKRISLQNRANQRRS